MTVTQTNMMDTMHRGYGTLGTTAAGIWQLVFCRATQQSQLLLMSSAELHRGFSCSKICLFYKSHLVAFWMHLHNCSCFQKHLTMLLHSLRALSLPPGGPGSIWKDSNAQVWSTSIFQRIASGFWTDLQFGDICTSAKCKSVRKQHSILPDTPGDLTSASKYF